LLQPLLIAIVVSREAIDLGPDLTEGSCTVTPTKEVPKYIKVPAIAATLAFEKKACKKTARPNKERPNSSKKMKTSPLFEY
jgi:hypothetical protein